MTPSLATAAESVSFTPVSGVPYQKIQTVPRKPENPTLGDDYFRDVGEFQVFLCYPSNQGVDAVQTRADAVRNHFKRGTTLIENDVEVLITRTPQIAGNMIIGDRVIVPVLITYSVQLI